MKRYKITPELKEAIKNSEYSMRKISQVLGFEVKNIFYRNISIREESLQKLKSLLNFNLKLEEITLDYGKNLGKCAETKPIKPLQQSEELAELVGVMLGDGNIFENQIKVFLDSRDSEYVKYLKNLLASIIGFEPKEVLAKGENCIKLYYYNKFLAEKLMELGLRRGDKIRNQVPIPQWIKDNPEYAKRCLKGLVDTDGCIIFCKRDKQRSINFTNRNLKLLSDFKEVGKKLGYNFAKANKWNTRLYRKAEVARFINDIKPFKANGVVV